jgi:hypothetical protein
MAAYTGTALDNLQVVTSDDDSGLGNTSQLVFEVSPGVTYHIAVAGFNNGSGIYWLNWDLNPLTPSDDSNEDNDTFAEATDVPRGQDVGGQILTDDDWFKLNINPNEHLQIDIDFNHSAGDINAQLYDRRGAFDNEPFAVEVAASYSTTNDERLNFVNITGATELYLRVYGEQGAINTDRYSIEQTLYDTDDELEKTNDSSCGTLVLFENVNTIYRDMILRDDDWYRVDTSQINELRVEVDHDYFSGDLDIMITRDTGTCDAYNQVLALGNTHDPNIPEIVTADVTGLDTVLIRIYGEQGQTNFYDLELSGN